MTRCVFAQAKEFTQLYLRPCLGRATFVGVSRKCYNNSRLVLGGWSGNLVTPQFGAAVYLASVLTSAEVDTHEQARGTL
jgi:hypothetical protein